MSFVVTTNAGKQFEKPESGMFSGVLADVVDLGQVTTTYNGQTKTQQMVRFVWFLSQLGKDGKQLSVAARYGINLHEKSNLYKAVKQIIGGAPPLTLDLETLVGQVRQLFIVREQTTDAQGNVIKDFANIQGIAPAAPGATVTVPADFVRDKNKTPDQQAKNKKKGTFAQPQAQPQQPVYASASPQGQPAQAASAAQGADIRF